MTNSKKSTRWLAGGLLAVGAAVLAAGCVVDASTSLALEDIPCDTSYDCDYPLTCLADVSGDSWCADFCIDDSDCGGGCCSDTDAGAFCFPDRYCGGAPPVIDNPTPRPLDGGTSADATAPSADVVVPGMDGGAPPSDVIVASDAPTTPPDAGGGECTPPTAANGDGHHNEGKECLGCHATLAGLEWTVAGTLYDSLAGTNPVGGATIQVTDANGQSLSMVTSSNGNFWTMQAVAFPLTVAASSCPDTAKMIGKPTNGGCNAQGCHADGNRIHLP